MHRLPDHPKGPPVTALIVHCEPCADTADPVESDATVYLMYPPFAGYPRGRYTPTRACHLHMRDAVNAAVRDGYPITVLPLETAP